MRVFINIFVRKTIGMRRVYYWVAILLAALPVITEAQSPPGWHKVCKDSLQGANVMEALRFLKEQGREIRQQIVVGVIDTGVLIRRRST